MPWIGPVGTFPRLNRGDHSHVVNRLASFFPFHVGDQREIKASVPQPSDRHVDFAVVEALLNECQVHSPLCVIHPGMTSELAYCKSRSLVQRLRRNLNGVPNTVESTNDTTQVWAFPTTPS